MKLSPRISFGEVEPRLRRALVALCGPEDVRDAVAEALVYAWEHRGRVPAMANPGIQVRELHSGPAPVLRHSRPLDDGNPIVHSVIGWLQGRGHQPAMPFRVALLAMPPPSRSSQHVPQLSRCPR